jgi:hypothetical protein
MKNEKMIQTLVSSSLAVMFGLTVFVLVSQQMKSRNA